MMKQVVITGSFDDIRSWHIRLLEEAAKFGRLHLRLWSDDICQAIFKKQHKFPQEERLYFLNSIRYVDQVTLQTSLADPHALEQVDELKPDVWVVGHDDHDPRKESFCRVHDIDYEVIDTGSLSGYPRLALESPENSTPSPKKVLVTGCFDWLHSGHVRFFEETYELGDLYVVVGHDENVHALKGEGHPMFSQDERRYMVQAIRTVKEALISTGHGWMDAEPEIARIKPDIYAVNEDGDKPEKRDFCARFGIDYVVLKRLPKEGLYRRESTFLRGF
jgi:cytidyltransferase-like protein